MEVIYGAQPLESGQIYYKGQPVKIDSPRKGIKTGIGLVPEDRKGKGLFLDKNVAWNSTINCLDRFANGTFGLVRTKEVEKEAEKYQKAFNIKTPSLNQLVMNLSGGNQQKVVLAKTMAADAEVIIFDEPTRGIDVGAKQEIYNLMNELAAQGKGILMVSSDMPELLGMCDRIVVISEGPTDRHRGQRRFQSGNDPVAGIHQCRQGCLTGKKGSAKWICINSIKNTACL